MYHPWPKKLQTPNQACGGNDTAWQFTKIHANVPLSTRELRNRPSKKSDFVIFLLSDTKLLTSIAYKLKQILSYFTHRTTSLSSQQPLSARLPANWQEWRYWPAAVPRSCNTTPFWTANIWWLKTARRNSYQPLVVCINCAIVEAWLPLVTCILKTLTCQAEVFCSWYMQIVEL